MKHIFTFMAGLALATSAYAIDLQQGKSYRIVSKSMGNSSTICVGAKHNVQPYIFSNTSYDGKCKDAFWYFDQQWDGSYAIYNAETKQYITYTTERTNGVCKGLCLTSKDEGATSHWFIEDNNDGTCILYTKADEASAKGDVYWNQRVNASDNGLLGTYSSRYDNNSSFFITDESFTPDPGPDPGPGPDVPDPTPDVDLGYTVLDGGAEYYCVEQTGNRLTIIPKDYIEDFDVKDHTVTLTLKEGYYTPADEQDHSKVVFEQVTFFDANTLPEGTEIPSFTSYKFNNKFNYQVFTDVAADDATASSINLAVGGIGKWLTASFQFSHEGAVAYIGETLQKSKETRQRFDAPMTYTVGYKTWRQLEVRDYTAEGAKTDDIRVAYVPYGRQQTVTIDWLADHPTSEYGVPRIDILLTDHPNAKWGSGGGWGGGWGWDEPEYFWLGQNGKTTYENAQITIDGAGVYPDMAATPILIKGRGNSTWSSSSSSKNPYHFKFESSQKPLGLTKGKHWVLLSNKQSGSMTTNAIGHRVADMMGGVAPCHIVPVELYINGSYRGSYNLCERIGFGNNSIDLDDETNAAMVELDTYTDETIYRDDWYYLATKMKDPDFDYDYTGPLSSKIVMNDWSDLMYKLYNREDVAPYVDVDYAAAYLAANQMICNCELKHAKSVFAYSENVTDGFDIEASADLTPWVFGPLWDCDWAFGYEQRKSYFQASQTDDYFGSLISGGDSSGRAKNMWNALYSNSSVNQAYYYKVYNFVNNCLPELVDFCDEYYAFAKRSFDHNTQNEANERDGQNYATLTTNAKSWLQNHAADVLKRAKAYSLPTPPVDPDPVYEDPTEPMRGSLAGGPVGIDRQLAGREAEATYDLQGRRVNAAHAAGIKVSGQRKAIK